MIIDRTSLAILAMALAVLACGPAGAAQSQPTSSGPSAVQPTAPPPQQEATAPPDSPGDDVASYIACEIVTPQDVADLVGRPIYRELEQAPGPGCLYEVGASADDYAQFIVYIQPTELIEVMIENMPGELGESLAGMGDAAYLSHDEGADTYDLNVLVRGRFGLEIIGPSEESTVALGALFLSRLVGP